MEHMFTRRKTADVSPLSSYGSCETKNKRCGSCILTTKLVTRTNYYDNCIIVLTILSLEILMTFMGSQKMSKIFD